MDHYLDIRILPDPEFPPTLLMGALYNKLHRVLVKLDSTDIGISFPRYLYQVEDPNDKRKKITQLGERIRLHSNCERLKELMDTRWLTGMNDHLRVGDISPVPEKAKYVIFRRVQAKSNAERIRRRQMRRHNYSAQQAKELVPDSAIKLLDLPFTTIRSHSTEQMFRLYIRQELSSEQIIGSFNAYGLSKEATVPLF